MVASADLLPLDASVIPESCAPQLCAPKKSPSVQLGADVMSNRECDSLGTAPRKRGAAAVDQGLEVMAAKASGGNRTRDAAAVSAALAPALAPAPPRPVDLQAVQAALKAIVTIAPLTFNQLIIELAKFLRTQVNDPVFTNHRQAISECYVEIYNDVRKTLGPAPVPSAITAPPPKKAAAPVKQKGKQQTHHDSDSEEHSDDGSDDGNVWSSSRSSSSSSRSSRRSSSDFDI